MGDLGPQYSQCVGKILIHFVQVRNPSHAVPMMEQEFRSAIRRCELPLMLDEATKGDGNCWVRAVEQQLERPEIREQMNARTREVMKVSKSNRFLTLKSKIAEFAVTSQHPTITEAKESFHTTKLTSLITFFKRSLRPLMLQRATNTVESSQATGACPRLRS